MGGAKLLSRLDTAIGELIAEDAERARLRARCAELEKERSTLETSLRHDSDEEGINRTIGRLRAIENEYQAALDGAGRREQVESQLTLALAEKARVLAELGRPIAGIVHELGANRPGA